MAVSFTYDAQHRVLIGSVSGTPTLEELTDSIASVIRSQEYPPDVNTLWDLREMEFHNMDYGFGEKLIAFRKTVADRRGQAKVALLSDYELAKPLVEIYRIMSESLPQPTQIFSRREDAMQWLCGGMDEATPGQ